MDGTSATHASTATLSRQEACLLPTSTYPRSPSCWHVCLHDGASWASSGSWQLGPVKNRFSDPTKAQEGRDRPRRDVMNRRRGKALSKGCCERKNARTVVSSREKINNNKNLARATTKSKSEM